jgi:CHAT domain-containing protein
LVVGFVASVGETESGLTADDANHDAETKYVSARERVELLEAPRPLSSATPFERNLKAQDKNQADPTARDRPLAETLTKEGLALAAEWNEASMRKAVEKLAAAGSHWHLLGNVANELHALHARGEIFVSLSEYPAALKAFDEALALSKTSPDRAHALNGLSVVYVYLGDKEKALSYSKRAYRLSEEANDLRGQAESLVNIGEVYYFQSESQKALDTFSQALSVSPDKNWPLRARTLLNQGYAHFDLRNMDQALTHYEHALSQSQAASNKRLEALALTAIGGVYSYLGNKQTALEHHNQAVKLFRIIGDRNGEAVALNGLGYVYRNLAEYQKSLDCYLRSLQLFQLLGNREYENFTITRVGKAYQGLGDNVKALEYYRLALARAANYPQTRAQALNSIGSVFDGMRRPREALVYYKQSLAVFRTAEDKMGEATILNNIGKVYSSFGKKVEALQAYRRALNISRKARDRRGEVSVLLNIAQTLRDDGDYNGAQKSIEDSLAIIESLRTEVASSGFRASYFASVREHYELYIDILMQLDKRHPAGQFAEQAFNISEKAHARSLLELLEESRIDIREGADPILLEQARLLQQDLNSKADRHTQLIAGQKSAEAAEIENEISQLADQYDQLEVQIKLKSPRYAALTQPQPLTLLAVQQQVLDENSLLLEYALGEERSYLWAVTRTEVTSFELPSRAEIEAAAREVHGSLIANQPIPGETVEQRQARGATASGQLPAQIANLSKILLNPIAARLGTRRLLIVADGALLYIPFQILNKPADPSQNGSEAGAATAGPRPLVADHEIVNEPSASALAVLIGDSATRRQPSKSVAVFADPVFAGDDPRINSGSHTKAEIVTSELKETEVHRALRDIGLPGSGGRIPRLLASRDEADAIIAAAPWWSGFKAMGFDASRATAMRPDLGDYRIIHFATHGVLNDEHPELSGVVLSLFDEKGQPQEGFLRLHDIYNLKLPVDLVVLSACNTGLGKDVRGEGLIGLTRGFMYAGASSVVASLWKVDDDATAELMRLFYDNMLRDGLSPAAALRKAQVTMSQQKRWQSPYYWSGFIIQGQYLPSARANYFATGRLVVWGGVAAALVATVFFVWKRRRTGVL